MDQVLWHSLHGQWFAMSDPEYGQIVSRTAFHADYLLLAYLPFYAIWSDPRWLMILQVIAVASGAMPLFWLARKKLGPPIGALMAVLYLLYPTQQWATIFDIHAVVLVMPLLLWAWWAAENKRWWFYGVTAGLAILGKEEIGLVVALMGLYWIWRRGYRWLGAVSLMVGVGWTVAMLVWVIPGARGVSEHFAFSNYNAFGDSYTSITTNILTHPTQVLQHFVNQPALALWRALLLPVGMLALAGWPVLLVAMSELMVNLLSSNANQHMIWFQYMAAITPIVFLATIDGWVRVQSWFLKWRPAMSLKKINRWLMVLVILGGAVSVWLWSPLPGMRHHTDALRVFQPSIYRAAVDRVRQSLQPDDRVATTNNLAPQFSRRDQIWAFPNSLDQADAIVVLMGGDFDVRPKAEMMAALSETMSDPRFEMIFKDRDFYYFRRVAVE
jgi:uncharacterized membrane protein